jgi:hypothetical protein
MKQETNKAQMNATIKKSAKNAKNHLGAPGAILEPNTGPQMYDEAIANRTIKAKLNSQIGKK